MVKHTLICLLKEDKNASFKTVKLSSSPSIDKLREVYFHNAECLKYLARYCQNKGIKSLRVLSDLFPLSSHIDYRDSCLKLMEEVSKEYGKINFDGVELSAHPDQFILLSSLNPNVNESSRYDLELYAHMRKYIPWNLVNIHVGSKAKGFEEHAKIFKEEISKLSKEAKALISVENDEKSYSFEETLRVAQENGIMMVPDFHHERCFQKRLKDNGLGLSEEEHYRWNLEIDENIYNHLENIKGTYKDKGASPLFHISSPINGWTGNFKEHCQHASKIHIKDYPLELIALMKDQDYRLDIEAKDKELAVFDIEEKLKL